MYVQSETRAEARVSVPHKEPLCPALNEECAGENDPVHQPWCQLGRVGGLEGFVGREEREEERCDRAVSVSVMVAYEMQRQQWTARGES